MLLWLCLYVSVVIAENNIQPPPAENQMKSYHCGNEEVLLKLWTILSNILDVDGQSVKVPSRDQVQYGLTLIKKHILEDQGIQNVDLQEKLFLREAELAKNKGIYLNDNRPLQHLLQLELVSHEDGSNVVFKYELPATIDSSCRGEFIKLIQAAHINFTKLANSPICSHTNIEAWFKNPYDHLDSQSSLKNIYDSFEKLQLARFNSKNAYNAPNLQNLNPIETNVNKILGDTEKPTRAISEPNSPTQSNLENIVKLTKDRFNVFKDDFTANLEHAKDVADKIKSLYQFNYMPNVKPPKLDFTRGQQFRGVNTNNGAVNLNLVSIKPGLGSSNITQRSLNIPNNNLYKLPPYNIHNPGVNQSYSITNIHQFQNAVVQNSHTSPKTTFVNAKYQPNPIHNNGAIYKIEQTYPVRNLEDSQRQIYSAPTNINVLYKYPTPYKIEANIPTRTENNVQPNLNNWNYNIYRYSKPNYAEKPKAMQNEYPYQPNSNPYSINVNYYSKYNQPNPAIPYLLTNAFRQVIQNENMPQPASNAQIHYTRLSHQNHNVPNQLTQQALNYNNQPVIDKLADWIAGTNSAKLNANTDSNQAEIELTYIVKEPPPIYQPRTYYIKFRLPYKAFTKHISELLTPQSSLKSNDIDLYKDLASQFNATVIPSDPTQIPKEDISNLEDKRLVRARYIDPNLPGKDDNVKSVDIINLVDQIESHNANVANHENNNSVPNAEVPMQPHL